MSTKMKSDRKVNPLGILLLGAGALVTFFVTILIGFPMMIGGLILFLNPEFLEG
jgi:hypothetical protein